MEYNIVIAGDKRVGKSSIASILTRQEFEKAHLKIWEDVSLKIVHCILFVYDCTNSISFKQLYDDYQRYKNEGYLINKKVIIVANKIDKLLIEAVKLNDERYILICDPNFEPKQSGKLFARVNNHQFIFLSVKSKKGFEKLHDLIKSDIDQVLRATSAMRQEKIDAPWSGPPGLWRKALNVICCAII